MQEWVDRDLLAGVSMAELVGREVVGGMTLEAFLTTRVLGPLEMTDTRFFVPDTDQGRLVAVYAGADPLEPLAPGLRRADEWPYPGAYRRRFPRHWAGGGLVSTLPDMVSLLRSLLPGGPALLRPETIAEMMRDQLPARIGGSRLATGSRAC